MNIFKNNIFIRLSVLFASLFALSSCYRQTVVIDQVPINTPAGESIYITGNFNDWDPGDERYRLNRNSDGTYSIELPKGIGEISYKFTRGDWSRVEKNECGYETDNRTLVYGVREVVTDQVACWGDTEPIHCTQAVILIDKIPANTPADANIYLASDISNWDPGNLGYMLTRSPKGYYYINLDKHKECMDFKFTLGSWNSVETDQNGQDIQNRNYCYNSTDTLRLSVKNWKSTIYKKLRKITFVLDKLPGNTKPGEKVYLAGSFNNWDPGNQSFAFGKNENGKLSYSLITDEEIVSYKLTLGNWKSVETLESGQDITNRTSIGGEADTLHLTVLRWKNRSYSLPIPVKSEY